VALRYAPLLRLSTRRSGLLTDKGNLIYGLESPDVAAQRQMSPNLIIRLLLQDIYPRLSEYSVRGILEIHSDNKSCGARETINKRFAIVDQGTEALFPQTRLEPLQCLAK
jgi:hypothetical protein